MTSKHTPGPWAHERSAVGEQEGYIVAPTHEVVAWIRSTQPDSEANARLIAAAPDLLAALERIATYDGGAGRIARDAIAKATEE